MHRRIIEQGFEMGRQSLIHLNLIVQRGKLETVRIGGHAVRISEGLLNIGNVIFGKNIGTVGTGSVGIGTQNPTAGYMLEVYGKARINGSIY
jgi:hypothetical protein